jgi:small conductance mechanosensitive channel
MNFEGVLNRTTIIKFGIALIILALAHVIAMITSRVSAAYVNNKQRDAKNKYIVYSLTDKIIYWSIMITALFLIPAFLGIETASLIALFGSITLAIGLGLQGTLADLAIGIMLLNTNTFKLGDYIEIVEKQVSGTIHNFGVLNTFIRDEDSGSLIIIPNRVIYENTFTNHSSINKHVELLKITISNRNKSLEKIIELIRDSVQNHPNVLKLEEPYKVTCNVHEINAPGTVLEIRYPLSIEDYQVKGTINVQAQIATHVRELLIQNKVELVDLGVVPMEKNNVIRWN